jgi:hypothetical protein
MSQRETESKLTTRGNDEAIKANRVETYPFRVETFINKKC